MGLRFQEFLVLPRFIFPAMLTHTHFPPTWEETFILPEWELTPLLDLLSLTVRYMDSFFLPRSQNSLHKILHKCL